MKRMKKTLLRYIVLLALLILPLAVFTRVQSVKDFIRVIRLERAALLLLSGHTHFLGGLAHFVAENN